MNCLVQILAKVSQKNIEILRVGMSVAAPKFRYYLMDPAMSEIPTSAYSYPGGGAMRMLSLELSQRKALGLDNIKVKCLAERGREHVYVSSFPCDRVPRSRRLHTPC